MRRKILSIIFLSGMISCKNDNTPATSLSTEPEPYFNYGIIGKIPVPAGFERVPLPAKSFGNWLRKVSLKTDPRVFLYNGKLKGNQHVQFAVLDVPVGDKDLQQCADAILRLRAEYYFSLDSLGAIEFTATDGTELSFAKWLKGERYKLERNKLVPYIIKRIGTDKRTEFDLFLEIVFSYCGTYSLDKEMKEVNVDDIQIGDAFIKPGSPGHAMLVADVVINQNGERAFMLAQAYMPAQDIHIVKNPTTTEGSPWFKVTRDLKIITPEWLFYRNQLKRWK